jgi:formate dehydrogenase maturation protein FdhE
MKFQRLNIVVFPSNTIATKTKHTFTMQSKRFRQVHHGYVDMEFMRSAAVARLQKEIIHALNPLRRNRMSDRDRARIKTVPRVDRRNIERYGYYAVGANFFPHLTLTKFPETTPRILAHLKTKDLSFTAKKLALCTVGDFGTCKKILATFSLL